MGYKYDVNPRLFEPHNLTPERTYILGVAWADGYLGIHELRITSADIDWLHSLPGLGGFTAPVYLRKDSRAGDLVVYSKQLVPVLAQYGFHSQKSVSGCPQGIPEQHTPHFMRGVVDGDGSIWTSKAQLRLFIAGNPQSTQWYASVMMGGGDFFTCLRSSQTGTINGRLIRNNEHCRVLQSRNSKSAEEALGWMYAEKGEAYLPRKFDKFQQFKLFSADYSELLCPVCGMGFIRRSTTDRYCVCCARIRLRLCNRRADHRRRNPEKASSDLNAYRKPDEMNLSF